MGIFSIGHKVLFQRIRSDSFKFSDFLRRFDLKRTSFLTTWQNGGNARQKPAGPPFCKDCPLSFIVDGWLKARWKLEMFCVIYVGRTTVFLAHYGQAD